VGKNKLARFAEMETLPNVVQAPFSEALNTKFKFKGVWKQEFFKNNNPLVLELGCGKGEYTVGLAKRFPEKNFLGVDIKGSRMWVGARQSFNEKILNAAFLRTRIELIDSFFENSEVDEIWITFPDPQLKNKRTKKRLTSSSFLTKYRTFLKKDGIVHLKTDSDPLFNYTRKLLKYNSLPILTETDDLYSTNFADDIRSIRTHYETMFMEKGENITYLKFNIHSANNIIESPDEEEAQ
jgi:tRNA (guanine-N7-)-methyltransferase